MKFYNKFAVGGILNITDSVLEENMEFKVIGELRNDKCLHIFATLVKGELVTVTILGDTIQTPYGVYKYTSTDQSLIIRFTEKDSGDILKFKFENNFDFTLMMEAIDETYEITNIDTYTTLVKVGEKSVSEEEYCKIISYDPSNGAHICKVWSSTIEPYAATIISAYFICK